MKIGFYLATKDDANYNIFVSAGMGYVAASVRRAFPEVTIVFKEKIEELIAEKPDIIGISSTTENYYRAIAAAQKVKQAQDIPVVLGGIHISLIPESLQECFDVAVIGEGETTFVELLGSIMRFRGVNRDDLNHIKGLAYYSDGKVFLTEPRDPIMNLDDLPSPDIETLPYYQKLETFCYLSARGCPYQCSFCASQKFARFYRSFSNEKIARDIDELVNEKGYRHVVLFDDLLIANKKRIVDLADKLEERHLLGRCGFSCQVRANVIDDEICRVLKKINVVDVGMGVESFSDKMLQYYNKKGVTAEINQRAIDLLARYQIKVNPSIIFGAPIETREDMLITLRAIYKNFKEGKINAPCWGLLRPYPGTKIWDYALSKGLVSIEMDWEKFEVWSNFKNYLCEQVSADEFVELIDEWQVKYSLLVANPSSQSNFFISDKEKLNQLVSVYREKIRKRRKRELGDELILKWKGEKCHSSPHFLRRLFAGYARR